MGEPRLEGVGGQGPQACAPASGAPEAQLLAEPDTLPPLCSRAGPNPAGGGLPRRTDSKLLVPRGRKQAGDTEMKKQE